MTTQTQPSTAVSCSAFPGKQLPEAYVIRLAGTCCKCAESGVGGSRCGCCDDSGKCNCGGFNGDFVVRQSKDDPCLYEHTFVGSEFASGKVPCEAETLRLTFHRDGERVSGCVSLHFQSGSSARPAAWYKPRVCDPCHIGTLRRIRTNTKCCFPQTITVNGTPVPNYTVSLPKWVPQNPDDLNDSPFWAQLDLDLMQESPDALVRYSNGELVLRMKDISSDGFGVPWGHTRIYSNRLSHSHDFGNGHNWLVHEWPRLVRTKTDDQLVQVGLGHHFAKYLNAGPTGCRITMLRGTRNSLAFDEVRSDLLNGLLGYEHFKSKTGWICLQSEETICHHDRKEMTIRIVAPNGHIWEFYDFTSTCDERVRSLPPDERDSWAPGMLKRHVGPGGEKVQEIRLTYSNCVVQRVERTCKQDGKVVTERFRYDYFKEGKKDGSPEPNAGRLEMVTLERENHGTLSGGVLRSVYSYYEAHEKHGSLGDLKTVHAEFNENRWKRRKNTTHYFRYHKKAVDTYCQGLLKHYVGPESFHRLRECGVDPLKASDIQLQTFADLAVDYYGRLDDDPPEAARRVKQVSLDGGSRVFEYQYHLISPNAHPFRFGGWQAKTIETRPDSSTRTVYSSSVGQTHLVDLQNAERTKRWTDYFQYEWDNERLLSAKHSPSRVKQFKEEFVSESSGTAAYLNVELEKADADKPAEGGLSIKLKYGEYGRRNRIGNSICLTAAERTNGNQTDELVEYDYASYKLLVGSDGVTAPITTLKSETSTINKEKVSTTYKYKWYNASGFSSAGLLGTFSGSLTTAQPSSQETILPEVPQEQGGSGKSATTVVEFDRYGNAVYTADEINREQFFLLDVPTGAVLRRRVAASGLPQFTQDFSIDRLGRVIEALGGQHTAITDVDRNTASRNVRTAACIVYKDEIGEVWSAQGFLADNTMKLVNPVDIVRYDRVGRTTDQISAVRGNVHTKLNASEQLPQSTWVRWSRAFFDDQSRLTRQVVYHHIPSSGAGKRGKNYEQTGHLYDDLHRPVGSVSPGGTATVTELDTRGLPTNVFVGTTGFGLVDFIRNLSKLNVKLVAQHEYDDGQGGGNGHLTKITRYVDELNVRVTDMEYDWRGRVTDSDTTGQKASYAYNEQDQLEKVSERDTETNGDYVESKIDYLFDNRGRVHSQVHTRDSLTNSGQTPDHLRLSEHFWYDDVGNVVMHRPMGGTATVKYKHDRMGREISRYIVTPKTNGIRMQWPDNRDAISVKNDTVWEQVETQYNTIGQVESITRRRRTKDVLYDPGPLDGSKSTSGIARVDHTAIWYDSVGRNVAVAGYGDNGQINFRRPLTLPQRSDQVLVSTSLYNHCGELCATINPKGIVDATALDDAGRLTVTVENYTGNLESAKIRDVIKNASRSVAKTAHDRTVRFEYTPESQTRRVIAENPSAWDPKDRRQVTEYVYGTNARAGGIVSLIGNLLGAESAGDLSDIASTGLLRAVVDPLGRSTSFAYNRQGEVKAMFDRNGLRHAYDYDERGRLRCDEVTNYDPNNDAWRLLDDSVRRIEYKYDKLNRLSELICFGVDKNGKPRMLNSVERSYTLLGQIKTEDQDHGAGWRIPTVHALPHEYSTNRHALRPRVLYNYANPESGALSEQNRSPHRSVHDTHSRPEQIVYPGGRTIYLDYPDRNQSRPDLLLNRVRRIREGSSHGPVLAEYSYFGIEGVQNITRPVQEAGVDFYSTLDTAGRVWPPSDKLDRFDRRDKLSWYLPEGGGRKVPELLEQISYDYDRHANVTQREDRQFVYDDLERMTHCKTGKQVHAHWNLDHADNWNEYYQEPNAPDTAAQVQVRGHDAANRVSAMLLNNHPAPVWPAYDKNGNTTRVPKTPLGNKALDCTYDFWNRLVRVDEIERNVATGAESSRKLVEYDHDGLGRRIVRREYNGQAAPQETRHYYYNDQWQVLSEWIEVAQSAGGVKFQLDREYVWGLRGPNDLLLRDDSTRCRIRIGTSCKC